MLIGIFPLLTGQELLVYSGAVVPEVIEAYEQLKEEIPELGIMAITSYDRLYHDWQRSQVENIEGRNNIDCHIISCSLQRIAMLY